MFATGIGLNTALPEWTEWGEILTTTFIDNPKPAVEHGDTNESTVWATRAHLLGGQIGSVGKVQRSWVVVSAVQASAHANARHYGLAMVRGWRCKRHEGLTSAYPNLLESLSFKSNFAVLLF